MCVMECSVYIKLIYMKITTTQPFGECETRESRDERDKQDDNECLNDISLKALCFAVQKFKSVSEA